MPDLKNELEAALAALGESSRFCLSGSPSPLLPGLEVRDVGSVGIPVSQTEARRLIAQASQAPYGRGEETIVDPDVRRVWQLEPRQFSLRNSEWRPFIAGIVASVQQAFGISQRIDASLYKLLIYEPGSFFAPHRDTEKTAGMFATLVVGLPSRHKGGTLLVTHDGQTEKIDFGGAQSEYKMQYAAFYADCQHEIRPVTEGYRVCLVYNLAVAKSRKQPSAPKNGPAIEQVAQLLTRLFADRSLELDRLAIPLAHQYTEASFSPSALKGADRTRADVVLRAAETLGYQAYLALLTHHQSGEVDYSTYSFRSSWSRRRQYEEEDDEEDVSDSEDASAEMGEVYDEDCTLDHWFDAAGREQPLGEMSLNDKEVLHSQGGTMKQTISEATGNAGATLERWYRRGVVVLWPRDRHFRILAGEGQAMALPALAEMVADAADPAANQDCRELAEQIIQRWNAPQYFGRERKSLASEMLMLLERIDAENLVQQFVRDVLPKDYDGSEGQPLVRICGRLGWKSLLEPLFGFFASQAPEQGNGHLAAAVAIFEALCCNKPAMTDERRATCQAIADAVEQVITRCDGYRRNAWSHEGGGRAGIPERTIRALNALADKERLDRYATHVLASRTRYGLHETLIPAVQAISKWIQVDSPALDAYQLLRNHCIAELQAFTAEPVNPPGDWRRDAKLGCDCADCKMLGKFLRDPHLEIARFPLRQDRRQHLHQEIDHQQLDLTHVTERKGSPHTLVCTKTQASYQRRLKQFEVDSRLLHELEKLGATQRRGADVRSKKRANAKTANR